MPRHIERRRSRAGRPRKWIEIPLANWMKASGIRAEDLADELGDRLGLAEAVRGLGKAYLARREYTKIDKLVLESEFGRYFAAVHR